MKTKPIGISQWKLLGKKYGYYKYFEDEVRQSEREWVIEDVIDQLEQVGAIGDLEILKYIRFLKKKYLSKEQGNK